MGMALRDSRVIKGSLCIEGFMRPGRDRPESPFTGAEFRDILSIMTCVFELDYDC